MATIGITADAAAWPVRLEWSRDQGATWEAVVTAAAPEEARAIPLETRPFSGVALVRAVAIGGATEVVEVVIDNEPPKLRLQLPNIVKATAPLLGSVLADEPITVTATTGTGGGGISAIVEGSAAKRLTLRWSRASAAAGRRDGHYWIAVRAVDQAGNEAGATARLTIDTTAPVATDHQVAAFGRGRGGVVRFHVRDKNRLQTVDLRVRPVSGERVERVRRLAPKRGLIRLAWRSERALPPGAYEVEVLVSDAAGNSTTARRRMLVRYPVQAALVSRVRTRHRQVALTFDDCYDGKAWDAILDVLRRHRVKAAFFCPGNAVLAHPRAARRTLEAGHVIGSHGWDHANFWTLPFASALTRLRRDDDVWWRKYKASATPYFRPPYGAYSSTTLAAAGAAGYTDVVLWDIDPLDWTRPGPHTITQRVLAEARAGSIVLLHTLPQTAAALPKLISRLRHRGLEPVGLDNLINASNARATAPGWPWRRT